MNLSAPQGSASFNAKRGKGPRVTRAGIDQDSFPFHKLSVDGAKLAESIISPLPDPKFAMFRAKDPLRKALDQSNSTCSTNKSTTTSYDSDEDSIPLTTSYSDVSKPKSKFSDMCSAEGSKSRTSEKDQYYENPASPEIQRRESFPAKDPGSITYSTKFVEDPNYEHNGSQDGVSSMEMTIPALKEQLDKKETEYALQKASKASLTTRTTHSSNPLSSKASLTTRSTLSSNALPSASMRSVDPEAKHISGIFRRADKSDPNISDEPDSTSDSSYFEESLVDSYYEVPDSPRASQCEFTVESYTDGETNSGWESGVDSSLNNTPKISHTLSGSTDQSRRIGPDGTLHMSPKLRKEFRNHVNFFKKSAQPRGNGWQ